MTDENDLVVLLDVEVQVTEQYLSVDALGQSAHFQNLVTRLPVGCKENARITTAGGFDLFDVQFLQHFLAAGSLFRLGHIGTESADELFQLLLLLLSLLVLLLLLTQCQLAGFVPETVVTGKQLQLAIVDIDRMGAD